MALSKEEIEKERDYLSKVLEIIKGMVSGMDIDIHNQMNEIVEMKRFMWENQSDFTDEEKLFEMYSRDNEVNATNANIKALNELKKAMKSPYFGKIDFLSDEFDGLLPVYVGLTAINQDQKFYVFDWRAPISSLFYNYEVGKAEYVSPNGKIDGEIINKRQFKIENGNMIRCFDSAVNIDDDFLQEVLSKESTEKMQNIVSTIQKEQNEIIRNEKDKFLIVQGIAGSGKTSVALHRVAYLLYRQKDLTSKNVLIFSPNDLFSYYISDVLPDLGEENTLTSTFYDFSKTILNCKSIESFTKYLERTYKSNNEQENAIIKVKMSDGFEDVLKEGVEKYTMRLMFTGDIKMGDKVVDSKTLNYWFHQKWSDRNIETRIEFITKYVCDKFRINYKRFNIRIRNAVLKSLNRGVDPFTIYNWILQRIGYPEIKKDKIRYEDASPLLYINFLINNKPNYSYVKQVVIDEAQDYSKLQIKMLNKLFPNASFTILGDVNQTINPNYKYRTLKDLGEIRDESNYIELNKTYRSSQEIIDYSNKVLGLDNVCAIRHTNSIPVSEVTVKKDELLKVFGDFLQQLKDRGFKKNAIITKTMEQANFISNLLQGKEDVVLVKESLNTSMTGNLIIPSYLSKGLEFDAVIVYNDLDHEYTSDEVNLYYVVLTRAQHQLIICNHDNARKRSK